MKAKAETEKTKTALPLWRTNRTLDFRISLLFHCTRSPFELRIVFNYVLSLATNFVDRIDFSVAFLLKYPTISYIEPLPN